MFEISLPLSLLDLLGDAAVIVDAQDRVQLWSQGAEEVLGLAASACLGRPLAELLELGGEPLLLGELRRFLAERRLPWRGDGALGTRSRPVIPCAWSLLPVDPEAPAGALLLLVRERAARVLTSDDHDGGQGWGLADRVVSELITLPPEADFFGAAARQIQGLSEARFVAANEVIGESVVCRAYASARTLLLDAAQVLGVSPVGLELPLLGEARDRLSTGRLHQVPGGLHAILLERWPRWLCRLVERSADLGAVYAIGFCWQGTLLGSATLGVSSSSRVPIERIEALANLVALAFQKRQTEAALRRSEERYRTLFQSSALAIGVRDLDGAYLEFNQAYARMLGYSLEELADKRTVDITHPDDVPVSRGNMARVASGETEVRRYLKRYLRKDGSVVWGDVCIQPLRRPDGKPHAILGTVVDVTERWEAQRESEAWKQRYELLSLSSGSIVYDRHSSGEIVWGGSHQAVLGYTLEELAGGFREWLERVHPEDQGRIEESFESATRAGSGFQAEYRFRHREGHYLLVQDTGYPVKGAGGKVERLVGAIVDITAEKRAEEERRTLEEQLRQAQKMESIGRLAGGVAHDFNNIMTGIMGYTELLLGGASEAAREDLLEIKRAAKRAAGLTAQLLAFSRKQIFLPRKLDLGEHLRGSARMLERLIGEDVELSLAISSGLAPILADPGQIDQVLFNLAVNARDAMPGGGKLTVAAAEASVDEARARELTMARPGDFVVLSVSDSGHGMSQEILERLFEPFFTTKERGKGTGLGLATVFGILQQNEGFIEVSSAPGRGSCFNLYWPRSEGPIAAAGEPQPSPRPGHETVLVVEDEESVRSLAQRFLRQNGYRVLGAATVAEAEAALRQADPRVEILLTDVIMPGVDGRQLYERLRALQPELKVVYMSGYAGEVIAHHGVLESSVHFLPKPFDADSLTRALRAALDEPGRSG